MAYNCLKWPKMALYRVLSLKSKKLAGIISPASLVFSMYASQWWLISFLFGLFSSYLFEQSDIQIFSFLFEGANMSQWWMISFFLGFFSYFSLSRVRMVTHHWWVISKYFLFFLKGANTSQWWVISFLLGLFSSYFLLFLSRVIMVRDIQIFYFLFEGGQYVTMVSDFVSPCFFSSYFFEKG